MAIEELKSHPSVERYERIPAELRGRATCSVPTAAQILGLGRDATYAAVKSGQIVSLHFGSRIVIPVAPLLRMLGLEPPGMEMSGETEVQPRPTAGGAYS